MAYTPHTPVKPEKIAAAAAVALEEQLVIPATFQREGIDQYKGAKNDTINVKVKGILPFHEYGWRNNRANPVQFDEYSERTVQVSFGGDTYNAVKLTDEQADFDFESWTELMVTQTEGVGRGLEFGAVDTLIEAPYEVTLGGTVADRSLRATLIRARDVLNKFRVPAQGRTLLVGSDWESALLNDPELNLASNVGEAEAVSALREATIGRRFGFTIVASPDLPAGVAVAQSNGAFIFATGAPSVPGSVPFGATAAHKGVALRWIRDYSSEYLTDRSIVNTYKGFRHVVDPLLGRDGTTGQAFVSNDEYFVRAIKLDLAATEDALPENGGELASITGVEAAPAAG